MRQEARAPGGVEGVQGAEHGLHARAEEVVPRRGRAAGATAGLAAEAGRVGGDYEREGCGVARLRGRDGGALLVDGEGRGGLEYGDVLGQGRMGSVVSSGAEAGRLRPAASGGRDGVRPVSRRLARVAAKDLAERGERDLAEAGDGGAGDAEDGGGLAVGERDGGHDGQV